METKPIEYREAQAHSRPGFTISDKIGTLFLILLLLAVANVVIVRNMLQNLNGVAATISVAGKLRMLSQKIAFETIKVVRDDGGEKINVITACKDFDTALAALGNGGNAFGYGIHRVPALLDPQLDAMRRDWTRYRQHTDALLAAGSHVAPGGSAQVTADAARVLAGAEELVAALTSEAQQAQQHALFEIDALLLLDGCVLTGFFLVVRKQIAAPLRELAQRSRELAAGDYAARIDYRSRDEIGQLVDVFNQTAQQIGKLVARVELDRRSLQQADSMFRGLAENSVVGVYISQDHAFRFVNPKMAEMFGYEPLEMCSSVDVFDTVVDEDRDLVAENIDRRLAGEVHEVHYERRARRKGGMTFDVEIFGSSMDIDGKAATIGVVLDITERRRVDRALRVLIACNQALVRATKETALLTDICRIVQQIGGYPYVWVGYADNALGRKVTPVAWAEAQEGSLSQMVDHISWDESDNAKGVTGVAIRGGRTTIVQDIQSNGLYAPWREFITRHGILSAMSLPLKAGNKTFGALTMYSQQTGMFTRDEISIAEELADNVAYGITALRADAARIHYAQQLEHNATHDVLTGLANRTLLSDRLKQAIASARRFGKLVAVLLLDLDDFKGVNDSLGHEAGDALLQAVARRLHAAVREPDTVARLGGDEFVIVMPDLAIAEDVLIVASKILALLSQGFSTGGEEIHIGGSIGISLYPHDGEHEDVLMKNVDLAMYHVKQGGRAGYHFFTEELNLRNQARHVLRMELRHALSRGELVLHYQAKVDTQTRRLVGAEALVRWQHPLRGMIPPADFIPFAEESGLILPIGDWVMRTACQQNVTWQTAGLPAIRIAVNLSACQFGHHDLVGQVRQVLRDTRMDPQYLELELTESVLVQEAEQAVPTLSRLNDIGIKLSLDDFGTGYSSLNYLRRFPLDNLKIDRSFISGMTSNAHDAIIVEAVIALAHNLKLRAIAEGVETREELDLLAALGCDEIQGFYFSKPLPADEFKLLLVEEMLTGAGAKS